MSVIKSILDKIGISRENGFLLDFQGEYWKSKIPYRLHKGLEEIKPDSFFVQENRIIALFFYSTQNIDVKVLSRKIWNLGGVPTVFIIRETTIDIYNGFSFDTEKSTFDRLKIGNTEITEENINKKFSIWDIFSGKSFENFPTPKPQVDEKLLENLEATKDILEQNGLSDVNSQNIIGRLLFSRYLLDRSVKIDSRYFTDKSSFLDLIKNKKLLYEYFKYLKETFNGDLFPVEEGEENQITHIHLECLFYLFSGSVIAQNATQISLFDTYDFKIIPIELISEVYQRFMGDKKQKDQAAYYTPAILVDYILEKTVKKYLEKNDACAVLDPSCGSGIFLVESLRCIIENNLDETGKIEEKKLKNLVKDNIFGVDIDVNAINITAFSLCLTLLDYVEPKDITKFKFPSLKDTNLFKSDFFDLNNLFNKKIKKIKFILGNPPWGSDKEHKNSHIEYFEKNEIPVSDKQFAQTFLARTKDFSEEKTGIALVLPSKILYNHNAKKFRRYWLENFYINEVLELSAVRRRIFSKPIAPTAIVFFEYSHRKDTKNNILTHTSIKPNIFLKYLKLLVIEKNDIKQIKQEYLQENDWLWKIMLYGNILDFYFIQRLKKDFDSLNTVIEKNNLTFGQGFIKGKNGKYSPRSLLGEVYLDTNKKPLSKFSINEEILSFYNDRGCLYREGKEDGKVFEPPYTLLKRGFSTKDFSLISAYTEKKFVFTNSITAIGGGNKNVLKSIAGVLNSIVHSYFLLLQGASAGIEREESLNEERFEFPMIVNKEISKRVDEIQLDYKKLHAQFPHNEAVEEKIKGLEKELNNLILDYFETDTLEKRLIDYAMNISIPLINNSKKPTDKVTKNQYQEYAQIFFDHFGNYWNGNPDFFELDIYLNSYVMGMNFKIVTEKPKKPINIHENKKTEELFQLMKIGEEKINDIFYKQRDIRGFNKNSFYIIKANQYKNWHPAIAEGDLREFINAMLDAEKNLTNTK